MESNYDKQVKALQHCMSTPKGVINCKGCPYFGSGIDCQNKLHADAADAIEALQAELDQWKAAVKGQEDGIKVLQAEVERLQVDLDAAYALMEVQHE